MNDTDFNYFRELADTLNFSKAAGKLNITQPALSRCIAKLEDELNTTLVIRGKHGVNLTNSGRIFLREFPKVKAAIQRMEMAVQDPLGSDAPNTL